MKFTVDFFSAVNHSTFFFISTKEYHKKDDGQNIYIYNIYILLKIIIFFI